jgi:hypothetical protein
VCSLDTLLKASNRRIEVFYGHAPRLDYTGLDSHAPLLVWGRSGDLIVMRPIPEAERRIYEHNAMRCYLRAKSSGNAQCTADFLEMERHWTQLVKS